MLDAALLKPCGGCVKAEGVFGRLLAVGTDLNGIHSPGETMAMFGSFDQDLRKDDPYNDETWHTGDNWKSPVLHGLRGPEVGELGAYPWKIAKGGQAVDGIINFTVFAALLFFGAWAASHITKHGATAVGHVATGVEHAARGKKAWRSAA
jgi:hypothetical protein